MDITITYHEGRWKTDPNPAIVMVGTRVRWIIRAPTSQWRRLRWVIRFGQFSPFGDQHELVVETNNTGLGGADNGRTRELSRLFEDLRITEELSFDHRGVTEAVTTESPGQFKYDLLVADTETDELLDEEDPILVVLRGPFQVWLS